MTYHMGVKYVPHDVQYGDWIVLRDILDGGRCVLYDMQSGRRNGLCDIL